MLNDPKGKALIVRTFYRFLRIFPPFEKKRLWERYGCYYDRIIRVI